MSRLLKAVLFLFILVLLDNNVLCIKSGILFSNAYAEDKPPKMKGGEASFPACGVEGIAVAIGLLASAILVFIAAVAGGPIAWGLAIIVLTATVIASLGLIACLWSFVRNPVLRDEEGNYRYCEDLTPINPADPSSFKICRSMKFETCTVKSTNGKGRDDAGCHYSWPRNKSPYGKHIEVCFRQPLGSICVSSCRDRLDDRETDLGKYKPFGNADVTPLIDMKAIVGGALTCKTLKDGESANIGIYKYTARYKEDKLCAYVSSAEIFTSEVGCQIRNPSPPTPMCKDSVPRCNTADGTCSSSSSEIIYYDNSKCFNCYISPSCYGESGLFSHAQMSMTSMVVQCVKESLNNVLIGNCNIGEKEGFLVLAQKRLKDAVQAIILLSIILFGLKLMLGSLQGAHEWGLFAVKVSLIIYFTIGDGMVTYYYRLLDLSVGLSDIVQKAGGNQTICNFDTSDYNYLVLKKGQNFDNSAEKACYASIMANGSISSGTDLSLLLNSYPNCNPSAIDTGAFLAKLEFKDFSYLAIWDRLDCRIMFYLGSPLSSEGILSFGTVGGVVAAAAPMLLILLIPLAFLFVGQILISIVTIAYIILMILVIIWITHLFILSLIALTIVILFSPIFIPMALFQVTKNFFDGWLKEVMSYSLYPVILFAFLSLMFSVFDQLYFEDLKFKKVASDPSSSSRRIYTFALDPSDQCKTTNAQGENRGETVLACIIQGVGFKNVTLILGINVTGGAHKDAAARVMWSKLGMMALMLFLFYHFLGILGGLAAELVGNFRADMSKHVSSPQAMAMKAVVAGKAVASGGMSAAGNAINAVKKRVSGAKEGDSTDGSKDSDSGKTDG